LVLVLEKVIIKTKYYRQHTAVLTAIGVLTALSSFTNGISSVKDRKCGV